VAGLHTSPALALDDAALPSGGQVTGGSASFDYSSPGELHVHQSSDRAVIDWDSFNIGENALTQFHQNSASSIVVNRVTGNGDPTQILGSLRANGIVMVLDRNGVIFGANARVDVGGIIASTGTINDSAFMAGGNVSLSDIDTGGGVINHGMISVADAGLAAFVAPAVANSGIITARLGRIQIGSGESATLDLYGDGLLEVAVSDESMQQAISNTGVLHADGGTIQITAAAAKGIVNSIINVDGVVSASSTTVEGGKIILHGGKITVAKDAFIDASSTVAGGGSVVVYADDDAYIAGSIKASGSTDDNGGFIETSATNRVTIADSASINTGGGQWLIDPTNFTIANSGGDITIATLAAQLAFNNVTIETADTGSDAGDIFVQNTLTWTGNKTLSLKAHRNIEVNGAITNAGGGSLHLRADKTGTGTGTVIFGASGSVAMSGGGRTDLYYNPASYAAPTNYAGNVTGTNTAWMLVNDVNQLQAMNTNLAGAYALGKDIDASATAAWNAGAGFATIATFTGKFDGLGHTISNLTINRPTTDYVALFRIGGSASISNVGLVDASITGQANVGALVARMVSSNTISNSYSTGTVTGVSDVGGLVGYSTGTISNSYSSATVSGGSLAGGLVGSVSGSITNSYATGAVSGGGTIGGLAAYLNTGGTIDRSYATGQVSSTSTYTGGLVGRQNSSTITNSYATGAVSGVNSVGGLVGSASNATISTSYATGTVSSTGTTTGGLVGYNNNGSSITNSYATGNVSSTSSFVGGLVGSNNNGSTITNSYATGAVTGAGSVGGLAGTNSTGTVTNSYWNTQTSGQATSAGGTGLTSAQMMQMASFSGWDISDEGGAGTVWRIYEGYTGPLLANFLTPLTITQADLTISYSGTPFTGGGGLSYSGLKTGDDASDLLGTLLYGGTAQGATNPGTYAISLLGGLYSGQQGYDISYGANAALTITARPVLMPLDIVRIVNAKLSATSTTVPQPDVALIAPDQTNGMPLGGANCLASMNGACIVQ
jgi:filamentous hemagglutinin family protein